MNNDIERVLYSQEEINHRADELAAAITEESAGHFSSHWCHDLHQRYAEAVKLQAQR